MKKVLLIAISSLLMAACSKDDNKAIDKNSFAKSTWELVYEEGYEIYNGEREEWSEKPTDYSMTLIFNDDDTGTEIYVDYNESGEEEYRSSNKFTWAYNDKANTLTIVNIDSKDDIVFVVEKVSSSEMILVEHMKEADYEYYAKETFRKK